MSELAGVVSTQTLGGLCVREYLGFSCIAGSGYSCTCDNVVSLRSELVKDAGAVPLLVLSLELAQYVHDTKSLVAALALTGFRFDWRVSAANLEHGTRVQVTYDLFRNENRALKAHILEGI